VKNETVKTIHSLYSISQGEIWCHDDDNLESKKAKRCMFLWMVRTSPPKGGGGGGLELRNLSSAPPSAASGPVKAGLGVWLWVLDISDFGSVNILLYLYAAHIPSTKSILSQDY